MAQFSRTPAKDMLLPWASCMSVDRLSAVHGPAKAKEMIAAVLLTEMYDVMKHQKAFDEARYRTRLEELEEISTMEESGLSTEIKELLHSYFSAFANLYGIIPLYRALRIIRKQNPELSLTEEEFLSLEQYYNALVCLYQQHLPNVLCGAEMIGKLPETVLFCITVR